MTVFVNEQAEMSVLGAALKDRETAQKVSRLDEELFHSPNAKTVITALKAVEGDIDLVTLNAEIGKTGADMTAYLVECAKMTGSVSMFDEYVKLLEECAFRRRLYELGTDLRKKISEGENDPDEVRQWMARAIREVQVKSSQTLIGLDQALFETFQQIEEDHKPEAFGGKERIYSGIKTLDEKLGGLRGGLYVAIGARPGVGKSMLALQYCANAAKEGKKALLISLEMDEVQITQRLLAGDSGVTLQAITRDDLDEESWGKLGESMTILAGRKLWYCTEANTVEKVRSAAYSLYENGGLDLIAIDYLQLMDATFSKKNGRQEQISEISRGLRKLAQELKIPILVLTQLNRESVKEYRGKDGQSRRREPTMSDARESGAIEQDANIFMLLHAPSKDEMDTEKRRMNYEKLKSRGLKALKIIIDKNRQGKNGRIAVIFDGDHMKLYDWDALEEE